MKCKFEHDGDCCNCGSPQYMCKCKPKICGNVVPITNADRIRAMSDEELAKQLYDMQKQLCVYFAKTVGFPVEELQFQENAPDILDWLRQTAEEDT